MGKGSYLDNFFLCVCVQNNFNCDGIPATSELIFRPPPVKIKKKKIKPEVEEPRSPRKLSDGNIFPKTTIRKLPASRKFSDANALPQVPLT